MYSVTWINRKLEYIYIYIYIYIYLFRQLVNVFNHISHFMNQKLLQFWFQTSIGEIIPVNPTISYTVSDGCYPVVSEN